MTTTSAAEIVFDRVTKRYPGRDEAAVNELSLTIPAGEICVLVGPSGAGKTTAMKMVNRLIEFDEGDITIDGTTAVSFSAEDKGRRLEAQDQLTLEFAGVWRQYHACLMRTLVVGAPPPRQLEMHAACQEALLACEAKLVPGATMGEVFDAHAAVFDRRGLHAHRLNACGYALGAVYPPSWMDWPMFYAGNPVELAPGMVFFLHMILMDSEAGLAMTLGRTSLVAERGAEPLSRAPLEPILR